VSVSKKDLAKRFQNKIGLSNIESLSIVNSFFKFLTDNHIKDINLNKFGTFYFKQTPERIGRNPKTLQSYKIKARKKLKFKPSDKIKRQIN